MARAGRLAVAWLVALVVIGCGTPTDTPAPSATTPPSTSAVADPSGAPTPQPTQWPGTTASSVIALGSGDGEIAKALADLQRTANAEDPRGMRGAAEGFVRLIDDLQPNVDRIGAFEHTKPLADAYRKSFPVIRAGAAKIGEAIASGDANGVVEGFRAVSAGMEEYAKVRTLLDDLVLEALEQQRLYTK